MPPKRSTNFNKLGMKDKVKCHICHKVMHLDELRDSHFLKQHGQTYKRPLEKGQSFLTDIFQKRQKDDEIEDEEIGAVGGQEEKDWEEEEEDEELDHINLGRPHSSIDTSQLVDVEMEELQASTPDTSTANKIHGY